MGKKQDRKSFSAKRSKTGPAGVRSRRGAADWGESAGGRAEHMGEADGGTRGDTTAAPGPAGSLPEPNPDLRGREKQPAETQAFSEPVIVLKHFGVMGPF